MSISELLNNNIIKVKDFKVKRYEFKEVEQLHGECYLESDSRKQLFLTSVKDRQRRLVGICRGDFRIKLNNDPIEVQERAKNIALDCITPMTKSSSPSMMLHQTCLYALALSIVDKSQVEPSDIEMCDLVIKLNSRKIIIDICGESENSKYELMTAKHNKKDFLLVINKYKLLNPKDDISLMFKMSERVDSKDIDYIYDKVVEYSKHHDQKPLYGKRTLDFFVKRHDSHGRSITYHEDILRAKEKIRYIDNFNKNLSPKSAKDVCHKIALELFRLTNEITSRPEGRVFCFSMREPTIEMKQLDYRKDYYKLSRKGIYLKLDIEEEFDNEHRLFEKISTIRVSKDQFLELTNIANKKQLYKNDNVELANRFLDYYNDHAIAVLMHSRFTKLGLKNEDAFNRYLIEAKKTI